MEQNRKKHKDNKFVSAVKFIFVKNIGLKALAIVTAAALWVLTVGLGAGIF